jgi:hypothetical protein
MGAMQIRHSMDVPPFKTGHHVNVAGELSEPETNKTNEALIESISG